MWLRKRVSELKAEKAQLEAVNSTNYITSVFQDFSKSRLKSSPAESNSKYKPNPEVGARGMGAKPVDNNKVTSAQASRPKFLSSSETLDTYKELQEGDDLNEISYENQLVASEGVQENPMADVHSESNQLWPSIRRLQDDATRTILCNIYNRYNEDQNEFDSGNRFV